MKAAIRRFLFMAAATVVTLLVVVAAHAIVLPIEKDVQGRPLVDADCPNDQLSVVWSGTYWTANRCKGTGGHPGMDIAIPSGTEIHAITNGIVEKSFDSTTWGGLIVIKHEKTLFGTSTPIWSIYAHLKSRSVNQGDSISENQVIGLSGGGLNDPNHGTSTGAHLHFQIDKGDIFTTPYWPSGETESPDPNLANNTYDPIAFIPTIDIKINHSNGPIIINSPDEFSTTRKVRPGILDGKNADWWLIADTPHGNYSFVLDNWVKSDEPIPLAQTQLFETGEFAGPEKWCPEWKSPGTYRIHFIVDTTMNGVLDGIPDESFFGDYVEVVYCPSNYFGAFALENTTFYPKAATRQNTTFPAGTDCDCTTAGTVTLGPGIVVKAGANIVIRAPKVRMLAGVKVEKGATFKTGQPLVTEIWSQSKGVEVEAHFGMTTFLKKDVITLRQDGEKVTGTSTHALELFGCCGPITETAELVGTIKNNLVELVVTWSGLKTCQCGDPDADGYCWIQVGSEAGYNYPRSFTLSADREILSPTDSPCWLYWNGECTSTAGDYSKGVILLSPTPVPAKKLEMKIENKLKIGSDGGGTNLK